MLFEGPPQSSSATVRVDQFGGQADLLPGAGLLLVWLRLQLFFGFVQHECDALLGDAVGVRMRGARRRHPVHQEVALLERGQQRQRVPPPTPPPGRGPPDSAGESGEG